MKPNKQNVLIILLSILVVLISSFSTYIIANKNKKIDTLIKQISNDYFKKKSDCNKIGNDWWEKNKSILLDSTVLFGKILIEDNPVIFYNSKLNTCLIGYEIQSYSKTDNRDISSILEYNIVDTLTNQTIKSDTISNQKNAIDGINEIKNKFSNEIKAIQN